MYKNKIYPLTQCTMYFDGCSKNNPGEAGIGVVVYNSNQEEIIIISQYIGIKTNNEAEYIALIEGLKSLVIRGIKTVTIFGDSQLVIKQVTGEYKVKSDNLLLLYKQVKDLIRNFDYIEFNHILRNKNKIADNLANSSILQKIIPEIKEYNFNKELKCEESDI
jgi:ribonuclease HI